MIKWFLSLPDVATGWRVCSNWIQTMCLPSHTSIYSKLILFTDSKHVLHFLDSLSKLQIQSNRLVTMSASLHIQTRLHYLIIQVLNIRVCFMAVWYTSLTFVHDNFEYGLAIITEYFSQLDLDKTTSFVKVQTRSDASIIDGVFHQELHWPVGWPLTGTCTFPRWSACPLPSSSWLASYLSYEASWKMVLKWQEKKKVTGQIRNYLS